MFLPFITRRTPRLTRDADPRTGPPDRRAKPERRDLTQIDRRGLSDTQAADYNQALAALLEAYDLLGEVVIAVPAPPLRGWNAPQQINDIYDRLWFALEKLAAVEPQVVAKARRQRISDPTRGTAPARGGWARL